MVTPQISGPPQLVQMTATPHGIPIMVPALAGHGKAAADLAAVQQATGGGGGGGGEDRDDTSSQASSEASDRENSAPPTKRIAVDIGGRAIPATRIPPGTAATGFMMTPTRHMVPTSHFTSPHVVQMGPNSHIPVVMPTTTATGFVSHTSSPMETPGVGNGVVVKDDASRRSPLENGVCSPHVVSGGVAKPTQVISASHLLHMTPPHHPIPLVLPSNTVTLGHHHGNSSKHRSSESSSSSQSNPVVVDHTHPSLTATDKFHHSKHNGGVLSTAGSSSIKMPFANIAIQSGNYSCNITNFKIIIIKTKDTLRPVTLIYTEFSNTAMDLTLSTPWVSPKLSIKLCTNYHPVLKPFLWTWEAKDTLMCPWLGRVKQVPL